jgi:hypothetical protein
MARTLAVVYWLFLTLTLVSRTWKFFDPGMPSDKFVGGVVISLLSIGIWFYLAIQCRAGSKSASGIILAMGAISLVISVGWAIAGESPMSFAGEAISVVHNMAAVALGLIGLVVSKNMRAIPSDSSTVD